jgi:glycosyltransferase involved in cell wall biosynthesis
MIDMGLRVESGHAMAPDSGLMVADRIPLVGRTLTPAQTPLGKSGEQRPPLVTIITATRNVAGTLLNLLASITHQSHHYWQWIVIDGGSTDGTTELLRQHEAKIDTWLSEPDRGVYDAWNKGLARARGDYVCFLGADDVWADRTSLARLVAATDGGSVDLVSARVAVIAGNGRLARIFGEPWSRERLNERQIVAHPGMLIARRLFLKYGLFDARYTIAGDYEWLMRLGPEVSAAYLDSITVRMGAGGLSDRRLWMALGETRLIHKKYLINSGMRRDLSLVRHATRILLGRLYRSVFADRFRRGTSHWESES